MNSFQRVVGVVKISVAAWVAMFCLAAVGADLLIGRGVHGCPPMPRQTGALLFFALPLGLYLYGWSLHRILAPRLAKEEHRPTLTAGPIVMQNPRLGPGEYTFCTTHPSYLLIDLVTLLGAYVLYAVAPDAVGCGKNWEWARGRVALAIALSIPALRIVGWYVLSRRPPEEATVGAWKPVAMFLGFLGVPLVLGAGPLLGTWRGQRNAPVVSAERFSGGLAAHEELRGKVVKVAGRCVGEQPVRCRCGTDGRDCAQVEVLLDVGDGGQVLVQALSDQEDLAKEASGCSQGPAGGRLLTVFGRLHRLPAKAPANPDSNTPRLPCRDYGPPPPAGRALVLTELP
jgi:hypothetical protein